MILCHIAETDLPLLSTTTGTIKRVCSFKLLGMHIDSYHCWSNHVDNVNSNPHVVCIS